MKRLLLSALLAVGSFGCAPKEVNYAVNIVTQSCDPAANPFDGVQFLRIRVTGDGMDPKTEISASNPTTRTAKIPEIPAGPARVIEVRGYDGDPNSGARVVSVGKSLPFDVPRPWAPEVPRASAAPGQVQRSFRPVPPAA